MDDKKLYQQKMQAQLNELKANIAKLKAKASSADASAKLEINKCIKDIEVKFDESKDKLHKLADCSDDAWDSAKKNVETKWGSLKTNVSDALAKYKA